MTKSLDVYLHEDLAGRLTQRDNGSFAFEYLPEWLNNPAALPLSQSLPLREKRFTRGECGGFFAGILPEESKKEIVARNLGISPENAYAMLERIGGECAGAVTFVAAGAGLPQYDYGYRSLSDTELGAILRELPRRPLLAGEAGMRLSLAGAQDKIAVRVEENGEICLPSGGAPSTHILKPAVERFEGVVYNEAVCMKLAAEAGLPTANVETRNADGVNYLLVERYDRTYRWQREGGRRLERLHQEDFCQAMGLPPERKYQAEGGPTLKQCFALLRKAATTPVLDLIQLLEAVIFNYLAGNNDAHGKNFSLLYRSAGVGQRETTLAPLYDIVCTMQYPELTPDMAMRIGGEASSARVTLQNFGKLAEEAGLGKPLVMVRAVEVANRVLRALGKIDHSHPVADAIVRRIGERAERLRDKGTR